MPADDAGSRPAAPLASSSLSPGSPPAERPAIEVDAEGEAGRPRSPFRPTPGWYPDPARGEGERWWDGDAWGERTRPGSPHGDDRAAGG